MSEGIPIWKVCRVDDEGPYSVYAEGPFLTLYPLDTLITRRGMFIFTDEIQARVYAAHADLDVYAGFAHGPLYDVPKNVYLGMGLFTDSYGQTLWEAWIDGWAYLDVGGELVARRPGICCYIGTGTPPPSTMLCDALTLTERLEDR